MERGHLLGGGPGLGNGQTLAPGASAVLSPPSRWWVVVGGVVEEADSVGCDLDGDEVGFGEGAVGEVAAAAAVPARPCASRWAKGVSFAACPAASTPR